MQKRLLFAAILVAGCGSNGSGTVSGTINTTSLNVKTALSSNSTIAGAGSSTIVLGSWGNGCAMGPSITPKNTQALLFVLSQAGASGLEAISAPGTFPIGADVAAGKATATYVGNDDKCVVTSAALGASGSVVVTVASSAGLTGTFDVTMTNGDHVTGSFDAPNCAAYDVSGAPDGGKPNTTCQ